VFVFNWFKFFKSRICAVTVTPALGLDFQEELSRLQYISKRVKLSYILIRYERGFRMNKKAVSWVVIGIIIIAVVVVGVVAYWALTSTGGGEAGPTPTPTPDVAGATSIGFKVNATINGNSEEYAFTAKNLGTSDIQLLVDEIDAQGNLFVYLYNQTAQTLWIQYGGAWTDSSADFATYWNGDQSAIIGYTAFTDYKNQIATNWSGSGDYSYTSGGNSYTIFDIILNPAPADSLFQHG
jgi:hypothetical protein